MDPEDLGDVISAYQKCVADTVRRFGGFVAKYMGDGVLVYFGYPQAHENDAERAVRAERRRGDAPIDRRLGKTDRGRHSLSHPVLSATRERVAADRRSGDCATFGTSIAVRLRRRAPNPKVARSVLS
jgi:hypothetical protein